MLDKIIQTIVLILIGWALISVSTTKRDTRLYLADTDSTYTDIYLMVKIRGIDGDRIAVELEDGIIYSFSKSRLKTKEELDEEKE